MIWKELHLQTVAETEQGEIDYDGDTDWFSFEAEAGELYEIDVSLGNLVGSWVELRDSDGIYQARGGVADGLGLAIGGGSSIVWEAPSSGAYYVEVLGAGGTGTYTLTVDRSDGDNVLTQLTYNSHADGAPAWGISSWSPDGSSIVFISDRDGDDDIYLLSIDSYGLTSLARLTYDSASEWHPALSPDGSSIAFQSDQDGDDEIYVMNLDESGVIQLTDNSQADRGPAWSPDGSSIVFYSDRDGDYEIYAMDADGSGVVQLTDNSYGDGRPAWSPNGNRIVFQSDRDGGP